MTRIRKGVITAAGRGTRLLPATRTVQKELFPLVDVDGRAKPTLQFLVEELLGSGVQEVCVVANPTNADPIRRHFAGEPYGHQLSVVVQETQDGYGHAVFQARDWAGGEPFVLTLGDHIYFSDTETHCARQVMDAYEAHGCPVTSVALALENELHRYGTIAGVPLTQTDPPVYEIADMVEKPTAEYARAHLTTPGLPVGQYLVHFGIHAFGPSLFDCLDHLIRHDLRQNGEFQLTSAQQLLRERERYLVCEVQGVRYDMGVPEGLLETQIALALRGPFAPRVRAMLGENLPGGVQ